MIKIGLLPLYIALYDEKVPQLRARLEKFYETAAKKLENCGFEVLRSPFCRIEPEFKAAVASFEENGAKCVVTLHMAYSPSLESASVLSGTKLPIVVLDATDTFDFSPSQDPDAISYCHGIHGVMDMCSLLVKNGKRFAIAAGHLENFEVISRAAGFVKAAACAKSLCGSRTGSIGGAFFGMGDFAVTDEEMQKRFGVEIIRSSPQIIENFKKSVSENEIKAEKEADDAAFARFGNFSSETQTETLRDSLAVRKWAEAETLSAYSVNFMEIGGNTGLFHMPFIEACKAMAKKTGYAGEGDVLTAAFTGALLHGFPDTSFVEIFCPDWRGNTLFLSHMGEMNLRLAAKAPEIFEKEFTYGGPGAKNPVACSACFKSGQGVFVNVFRGKTDFKLLVSPVLMEEENEGESRFKGTVRGWMRPKRPVAEFLESLGRAGATHHSILVYGASPEQIRFFGELLNLEVVEI
ncbi:MAG: hypothetical protein FWD23_01460 [Oscillospiraceae bacterium]|nr:hypothetical protein [Oscillospiraceae bacterium]